MRVRGGKGPAEVAALNLTSMIDCVFLLLIFFVSTLKAPNREANIQAYLPKTPPEQKTAGASTTEPKKEESNVIVIALRKGGAYVDVFLNGATLEGGFPRLNGALATLRHVAKDSPGVKTEIVIDAEPVVPYRYVVQTLDLCAKYSFGNISFAIPAREKAATP